MITNEPNKMEDRKIDRKKIQRWYSAPRVSTYVGGESRVDDSFGNDTDVNKIVERFARTGSLPEPETRPIYDDVTALQGDLTDLLAQQKDAMEKLAAIQQEQQDLQAAQREQDKKDLEDFKKWKATQSTDQPEPSGD